jgi:medium-chain acyl-[acyl-carrier-protein] hydrolase
LLDRPFAFFGHSMGAIVSFEMARWLRLNRNLLPKYLFVSGRRAPQIPDTDPPLHVVDEVEFLTEIRKLKGTPEELLASPDVRRLVLPALRADTELCETYAYVSDAALSCPITAFCGKQDEDETLEKMEAWRLQTTGEFALHLIEGSHFFIHSEEQAVLKLLRIRLSSG